MYITRYLRENIEDFLVYCNSNYVKTEGQLILEVGPENIDIKKIFTTSVIESIDISSEVKATYTGNICDMSKLFSDEKFDNIVCTEVFEHVEDPFSAALELFRVLKRGGHLFLTVPFNFKIHSNEEYFRFTKSGLKLVFKKFKILEIVDLQSKGRPHMPVQFIFVGRKDK